MTSGSRPLELGAPVRFYRSAARPCAYLPDRVEQLIFAELDDANARETYDTLTHAGFRRSHNIIYRPACANCAACIPVRIVAGDFAPTRSMKRIRARSSDLRVTVTDPAASAEQYAVFVAYQRDRHGGGDMSDMSYGQYKAMVEETTVKSFLAEFRSPAGDLVGAMLGDALEDGLSAVYSFFDPSWTRRSLGTYMVMWMIERARQMGRPYVYLGYWVQDSPKMAYKVRFRPIEALGPKGWSEI